jgi:hypothetical protein
VFQINNEAVTVFAYISAIVFAVQSPQTTKSGPNSANEVLVIDNVEFSWVQKNHFVISRLYDA